MTNVQFKQILDEEKGYQKFLENFAQEQELTGGKFDSDDITALLAGYQR